MYYIYEIYNKVTGRKYIGMTTNHVKRFETHIYNLEHGKHTEKLMQRDYVLYGRDSFEYRILEYQTSIEQAHDREKHYMKLFKTYLNDYGYNNQDPVFNKYQNSNESVNSQNYIYQKIKETGYSLSEFARKVGCSRKVLIHNITHPGGMKVYEFLNMVDLLDMDEESASRFMGWQVDDKRIKPKYLRNFNKLSEEYQDLVLRVMSSLLATNS